jgi:hypothetical protein
MNSLKVTKENFNQIRVEGIGNGFTVINPADGMRKDNRLWFGTCSNCNDTVTNSALTGKGWEHSIRTVLSYHADGVTPCGSRIVSVDYCPKG